jgi:hypothetical protein
MWMWSVDVCTCDEKVNGKEDGPRWRRVEQDSEAEDGPWRLR